jgi:NADH-quinone oxidoreductase subunit J
MFLIFALITLLGALAMFRQKNLVVAGLCLVLSFIGVAGLFLLLSNPVAAALQIIVYSGAIVVLVLFVIMLLNAHEEESPEKPRSIQRWGSALVVTALGVGAFRLVASSPALRPSHVLATIEPMTLEKLGNYLFQQHLLAFEAIGLLLLASMVAAILLVKRDL